MARVDSDGAVVIEAHTNNVELSSATVATAGSSNIAAEMERRLCKFMHARHSSFTYSHCRQDSQMLLCFLG